MGIFASVPPFRGLEFSHVAYFIFLSGLYTKPRRHAAPFAFFRPSHALGTPYLIELSCRRYQVASSLAWQHCFAPLGQYWPSGCAWTAVPGPRPSAVHRIIVAAVRSMVIMMHTRRVPAAGLGRARLAGGIAVDGLMGSTDGLAGSTR